MYDSLPSVNDSGFDTRIQSKAQMGTHSQPRSREIPYFVVTYTFVPAFVSIATTICRWASFITTAHKSAVRTTSLFPPFASRGKHACTGTGRYQRKCPRCRSSHCCRLREFHRRPSWRISLVACSGPVTLAARRSGFIKQGGKKGIKIGTWPKREPVFVVDLCVCIFYLLNIDTHQRYIYRFFLVSRGANHLSNCGTYTSLCRRIRTPRRGFCERLQRTSAIRAGHRRYTDYESKS